MGVSGYGSLSFQLLVFLNYVIGTKYKVIKGYKGGGAINLAMGAGKCRGVVISTLVIWVRNPTG
jgi:hypothetical protein